MRGGVGKSSSAVRRPLPPGVEPAGPIAWRARGLTPLDAADRRGESIAFSSAGTIADGGIKHDIRVVPATGGPSHAVTSGPADDVLPSWSPDGKWIAFQSDRSGELHIWVIPSTGGMAPQVTGRPGVSDVVARWSPGRY